MAKSTVGPSAAAAAFSARALAEESEVEEGVLERLRAAETIRGRPLVVTEAVARVTRSFCWPLTMALNEGIDTNAGTCFLLVGKKGTGKSSLLAALAGEDGAFAQAVRGGRVVTIHLDMDYHRLPPPVQRLELALGFTTPTLAPLEEIDDPDGIGAALRAANDKLAAEGKALVLLLDEYQGTYKEEGGIRGAWRELMYAIPNIKYNQMCRIFAVVSGSSAWLRALAFGKAEIGTVPKMFAGYTPITAGMNLNSQKYACTYLDNFSMADCRTILQAWGKADLLEEVYFHTGGVPRLMENYIGGHEGYPYTKAKLVHPTTTNDMLLLTMAGVLDQRLKEAHKPTPLAEEWMSPIMGNDLLQRLSKGEATLALLYQSADEGSIRVYDERHIISVSFTAPVLAAYMVQLVRKVDLAWLTPHLRLALAFPYGVLGIEAEEALRRCVAERVLGEDPASYCDDAVFRHLEGKFLIGEAEVERDVRRGHVFKEVPDTAGADAVWVKAGTLYRCQLKLGVALRSFGTMKQAVDKLKANSVRLKRQLGMPVASILAVTNPLGNGESGMTLANYAREQNVTLWDHSYLACHLWVDGFKTWATAGRHSAYYEAAS